jgi:catechol 2,3-dioxygenase-like lactoylglutathione lyase family enzyme
MSTQNTQTKGKVQLKGIDHFGINVRDMDRSVKFYRDLLGFQTESDYDPNEGSRHVELFAGNVYIALFETPDLDLDAGHEILTREGYLHWAFEAQPGDFDGIIETLKANGVKFNGKVRNHSSGPSAYFYDPDGNYLEIHANNPEPGK